jgi:hypothetical protein
MRIPPRWLMLPLIAGTCLIARADERVRVKPLVKWLWVIDAHFHSPDWP